MVVYKAMGGKKNLELMVRIEPGTSVLLVEALTTIQNMLLHSQCMQKSVLTICLHDIQQYLGNRNSYRAGTKTNL